MSNLRPLMILVCVLYPLSTLASPPTILNPTEPPKVETWHLQELWRLDNEEDEELPLMGVINQAVVTSDGHVLLLDSQMAQVLEISPGGEFLGTLSRMGQGPGELERPNTMFLADDGKLGLVQVFPGKIVLVNRDNTPGGSITAQGNNPMFFRVKESAGNLVISGQTMEIRGGQGESINHRFIRQYTREGEGRNTYLEASVVSSHDPPVSNEEGTWFPNQAWAMAADGSMLMASDRDAYRIEWVEPDGEIRRVITRDLEAHVRTEEERQEVLDSMRMWGPQGEIIPKKTILDTEPVIDQIQVLDDGRIWVKSCYAKRNLPEGVHCRYDVFDKEGRLEAEVHIAFPVNRETDYFSMLNDGRFIWYRNGRSALDAVYANMEARDKTEEEDEIDDEDMVVQVVLLERGE